MAESTNNDNDECICLLVIYSKFLRCSCCQRLTSSFRSLPKHLSRLVTPNTSTPHTTLLFVLLRAKQPQVSKAEIYNRSRCSQVSFSSRNESSKLAVILAANFLNRDNGSSLLVDNRTEASLAFDDDVWNTHLATEGRKEDHKLNWVNIMSNNNEGRFLCLDQRNDVIQAIFRVNRFFCILQGDISSSQERPYYEQSLAL
jgi:hypothetical protein